MRVRCRRELVRVVPLAVLVGALYVGGPAAGTVASHAPYAVTASTAAYGPEPGETETLFVPQRRLSPLPAVVFVHGGAWVRGAASIIELGEAESIASSQGWIVAAVNYPDTSINGEPRRQVEPAAISAAVASVAARPDVNPNHLFLWGESAGGNMALLTAYRDARRRLPRVTAVVSVSGPTNMTHTYNYMRLTWPIDFENPAYNYERMTPVAAAAAGSPRYSVASPASYVFAGVPPTFEAIGRTDPLVPAFDIRALNRRLAGLGVAHRAVLLATSDHSYTLEPDIDPKTGLSVMASAEAFLHRHFTRRG
jgi:acetyl esterase/lipase